MRFYAVLDCQSLKACPAWMQHAAVRSLAEQQDGEVSFYTCEDPESLPYGVFRHQMPEITADAICFFTTKQMVGPEGFDFPFLDELLDKWAVGFAREQVYVTKDTLEEHRPFLWREAQP